jgi:hypothetical protein
VAGSRVGSDGVAEATDDVGAAVADRGVGSTNRIGEGEVADAGGVGEVGGTGEAMGMGEATGMGEADEAGTDVGAGREVNVSDRGPLVRFNAVTATPEANTPTRTAPPISRPNRQSAAPPAAASPARRSRRRPCDKPSASPSRPAGSAASSPSTV